MSQEQVQAFYHEVTSNQALYDQYYQLCCQQGFFGKSHWDKVKIVSFAVSLGYGFTVAELEQVWFESQDNSLDEEKRTSPPTYGRMSYLDYEREKAKYPSGFAPF